MDEGITMGEGDLRFQASCQRPNACTGSAGCGGGDGRR